MRDEGADLSFAEFDGSIRLWRLTAKRENSLNR